MWDGPILYYLLINQKYKYLSFIYLLYPGITIIAYQQVSEGGRGRKEGGGDKRSAGRKGGGKGARKGGREG